MKYHIAAFFLGFLLDQILGDPPSFPHPVRLIGRLIRVLEGKLRGERKRENCKEFWLGTAAAVLVLVIVTVSIYILIHIVYRLHPYIGVAAESVMTYQMLAEKCLRTESMKVYDALRAGDIEGARLAVSMIVGRDTAELDAEGIAKAAVETTAENASDGVIAPMLYLAAGGPVPGFFYKAVNTMDSMIGYKNERYLYFGRTAAKLDDLLNFIPARISALLMIAAAFLSGREFSGRRALSIYRRDRRKHASPNAGQTEAVCAGALGIRLGGDASYFGRKVKKPCIGDDLRGVVPEDIRRACRLMSASARLCWALCLLGLAAVYVWGR